MPPSPTGRRTVACRLIAGAVVTATAFVPMAALAADRSSEIRTIDGALADGATYRIEVPQHWNGTVALYSHGLRFPGEDNPAETSPSDLTRRTLLDEGVALAGSSYARTGFALPEAIDDQLATLAAFRDQVGTPTRTIAWGESLGGMTSLALAEQRPDRIDAALPICGLLAGSVALWNSYLDAAYVMTTLLAPPDGPKLTDIDDPIANIGAAQSMVSAAAKTPAGRARLSLAAAVAQVAGRIDPSVPSPETGNDVGSRTEARIAWLGDAFSLLAFGERGEMEARAGGNPSWNTGVDYTRLLRLSQQSADVRANYRAAGLDVRDDLAGLRRAPRVSADPGAVSFLRSNVTFSGHIDVPVLTMHNVDDGLVPTSHEQAYRALARRAGSSSELRQVFVNRAGHCTMTAAEQLTGFHALTHRLDTGRWPSLTASRLNAEAEALGPDLNTGGGAPVAPAFRWHDPLPFPRRG